jgi:hypothetical protein
MSEQEGGKKCIGDKLVARKGGEVMKAYKAGEIPFVGSRLDVYRGNAVATGYGKKALRQKDLKYNKFCVLVSRKKSAVAKKQFKGGKAWGGKQATPYKSKSRKTRKSRRKTRKN